MRSNLRRQVRSVSVDPVHTRHPYTAIAGRKRHLASGLYPNGLESKHERRVTLDLLADTADDNLIAARNGKAGHRDVVSGRGGIGPLRRIVRNSQLSQTGNDIPVGAPNWISEQLHQPSLDTVRNDMLPPACLYVNFFPGQS